MFHVSQLKKVVPASHPVSVSLPDDTAAFQIPERILQIRLAPGDHPIPEVLVKWSSMPVSLATWENLDRLKQQFPRAPALEQAGPLQGGMSVLLLLHRLKLKTCHAEERVQGSPMFVYTGRSGSSPKC